MKKFISKIHTIITKNTDKASDDSIDYPYKQELGAMRISCSKLAIATNNFDSKIGHSVFGSVFKGFHEDLGGQVAVKRSLIGDKSTHSTIEYFSTIRILSRLRHQNLIKLVGWCQDQMHRYLVFEFCPKGSLYANLYGKDRILTWPSRYKIVLGLASALLYLHEELDRCILHRDINPSNIMLDSEFNPKLGAFVPETTRIAGTLGYLAPECITTGKFSKESDVYSFGVLCLAIACGRRATERYEADGKEIGFVEMVWNLYKKDNAILEAADARLNSKYDMEQMERLMLVGLLCASSDFNFRPSIKQVKSILNFETPLPYLPPELFDVPLIDKNEFSEASLSVTSSSSQGTTIGVGDSNTQVMESSGETMMKECGVELASSEFEELQGKATMLQELTTQPRLYYQENKDSKQNSVIAFSYSDLQQAASDFSESNKIGQGGFGKVYKGNLWGHKVAIKILHSPGDANQVKAFHREVDVLHKVEHPHLVRLIGYCQENYALIYEFMPGGTLEARLVANDLPWQDRIRIASEVCCALVFLHSLKPNFVVHGDLKPENILFDANGKSKLGDFGICRVIPMSNATTTAHHTTGLQGSFGYLDPTFIQTGRLAPSTDVYAFGMVLLRLITNKQAGFNLIEEVKEAKEEKRLKDVLDSSVKWPSDIGEELSDLAIRCCNYRVHRRPHLADEVCKKLRRMKVDSLD